MSAPGQCSFLPLCYCGLSIDLWTRIQNPLYGISKKELLSQVEDFAKEKGMEDITSFLQKGALIAQNPSHFETIQELDGEDKEAIRRETTRKLRRCASQPKPHFPLDRWSQPRDLYFTVILCSVAAAVQYVLPHSMGKPTPLISTLQRLGSDWIQRR